MKSQTADHLTLLQAVLLYRNAYLYFGGNGLLPVSTPVINSTLTSVALAHRAAEQIMRGGQYRR
jgi:hypothetical protein